MRRLLLFLFFLSFFWFLNVFSEKVAIENLHKQLHELNEMSRTLKLEMEAYDRLVKQFGIDRKKENALSNFFSFFI